MDLGKAAYSLGKKLFSQNTANKVNVNRVRIAAPNGGSYAQNTLLSNGTTQTSGTDRLIYQLNTDYAYLQVVLANGSPSSGNGDLTVPGNAVTFRMVLEQGGTSTPQIISFPCPTTAPVSTGGKTGHIIGDGEIQISAPVYKNLMTKNSYQCIRFYKTVSSGQKWPITYGLGNYNFINGPVAVTGSAGTTDIVSGTTVKDGSDLTSVGSVTFGALAGSSLIWAPAFIVGLQITPAVTVLITGDSVSAGFGDSTHGYIPRALELAGMTGQYINCGIIATTTGNLISNHRLARRAADYVDYVIIHTMSNDLNTAAVTTLAQAQAQYLAVAQTYLRWHSKLLLATILPRPATTDAGATYTGQTPPSWEALRVQINNWLRDSTANGAKAYLNARLKIGSVLAIYDPCVQIERNSDGSTVTLDSNGQQTAGTGGYFLAGGSTDTTHPNATAAAAAALSVPTNLLVLPVN